MTMNILALISSITSSFGVAFVFFDDLADLLEKIQFLFVTVQFDSSWCRGDYEYFNIRLVTKNNRLRLQS